MFTFQPKRFANNLALSENTPSDAPDASSARETKAAAPVIPIESAGAKTVRETSPIHKLKQWAGRNILVLRVDSITMAAVIALLPFAAVFLGQTNIIYPRSLQKIDARTGISVPHSQTRTAGRVPRVQGATVLAFQKNVVHKPDRTGVVSDVWFTSDSASAVVIVYLDQETRFVVHRISSPERIYLDLQNTKLPPRMLGKKIQTKSQLLRTVRVAEHERQITRITLVASQSCDYSVTRVPNSSQLRIELRRGNRAEAQEDKSQ